MSAWPYQHAMSAPCGSQPATGCRAGPRTHAMVNCSAAAKILVPCSALVGHSPSAANNVHDTAPPTHQASRLDNLQWPAGSTSAPQHLCTSAPSSAYAPHSAPCSTHPATLTSWCRARPAQSRVSAPAGRGQRPWQPRWSAARNGTSLRGQGGRGVARWRVPGGGLLVAGCWWQAPAGSRAAMHGGGTHTSVASD
jgi:hypothetical protein